MKKSNPPSLEVRKHMVENWNLRHPPGTAVRVRKDNDETVDTVTKSKAELLGGHTPVVWLEGISGCYALDRCTPIYA